MPELEEVMLIENTPQVPVANPQPAVVAPAASAPAEDEPENIEGDVEENPGVTGILGKVNHQITTWTGGVSVISMGVGAVGIVAAVVVPKLVKFNTGWKDLATTAVTMVLGGFLLGKVSKPFAVAFVMGVGGVLILKLVKWAMMGFTDAPILLDDLVTPGAQPILNDDFDAGPIYDAAENGLFDVAAAPEDIIHPTANLDDFY